MDKQTRDAVMIALLLWFLWPKRQAVDVSANVGWTEDGPIPLVLPPEPVLMPIPEIQW